MSFACQGLPPGRKGREGPAFKYIYVFCCSRDGAQFDMKACNLQPLTLKGESERSLKTVL